VSGGRLVMPQGIVDGAVQIVRGRIGAIRPAVPRGASTIRVGGAFVAPGFIDLHVWGEPAVVAKDAARAGTTAFLTTLGPEPLSELVRSVAARSRAEPSGGARCLGVHLEGPFVNPVRGGALPKRWMRPPTIGELSRLAAAAAAAAGGRLKLVTLAPELPGAVAAVRWLVRRRIAVSLGHSDATAGPAARAVAAGASAVTHVFNAMRPFYHRSPALLDVALGEPRLSAMVIADGVHVSGSALGLLARVKGPDRLVLVTDSIRRQGWDVRRRGGAYYTRHGVLAGSDLTMLQAVRNMVRLGGVALSDAVRMASAVPARLIGEGGRRGVLATGWAADLAVFDRAFEPRMTMVNGAIVFQRGS